METTEDLIIKIKIVRKCNKNFNIETYYYYILTQNHLSD